MDQPNPFDGGLLGDLLKVLSGQAGGSPWFESAKALALGVAASEQPESNPDPLERIAIERVADVAARHVSDLTGHLVSASDLTAVGRGPWALAQLDAWRPQIEAVIEAQSASTATSLTQLASEDGEMPAMFGQLAATLGPMLLGMQFGSAAGHLAERALGSYALPLPWPSGAPLLLVPENIGAFAEDWSIPLEEARLFAVTRELAGRTVISSPAVADRINELLGAAMRDTLGAQSSLLEKLGSGGDPEMLASLMGDPEALMAELSTPQGLESTARLTAATTALAAYVDHLAATVASRLTASHSLLVEAWRRHRITDAKGEQAAGGLFGLDLSANEVERGDAFVTGVLERAGEDGLARLLEGGITLPTPSEINAPGLWLERIALPELGEGQLGD